MTRGWDEPLTWPFDETRGRGHDARATPGARLEILLPSARGDGPEGDQGRVILRFNVANAAFTDPE